MADYKLIGKNYRTPDIVAKVTGRAKFAEDFRAEGMVFGKLLLSPMPHCRVRRIDASAALATPGVVGILTADELPGAQAAAQGGQAAPAGQAPQGGQAPPGGQAPQGGQGGGAGQPAGQELGLTNEPLYEGEPILMLAAQDEWTAADAIEKIKLDLEPLPFVLDPLESLRPEGPNARLEGNTIANNEMTTIKWTPADFRELDEGRLPLGAVPEDAQWTVGDVDAAMAQADLVLDETIFHQSLSHQPLETRSAMAYWQNGKCYLYASTQSLARTHAPAARLIGIDPKELVLISEYCGGGFGSKITGAPSMRFPALLSKKIGRPVMMRISRAEEQAIGRARPGFQGRVKIGFRKDGEITAIDLFIVQDNGPYGRQGDFLSAADVASLTYQPQAMRFRGISVFTNTPPRSAQRGPGGVQITTMLEPIIDKAARKLGVDRVAIRKINAPSGQAIFGRPRQGGQQGNVSSAFVAEAIDRGVQAFNWTERSKQSGQRNGTKVKGFGIAVGPYSAGASGVDGLVVIRPDGKLYVYTGVGNLGTGSFSDTARTAAEALGMPWEKVEIIWGDTSKNVPWASIQAGSQTTHAHTRANWAAGLDAKRKLQEIAARDLGGSPESYEVANERVFQRGNPSRGLTFARAADRAMALGGKYDGHEAPEDINAMTKQSAAALAGQGLMGVAKDNFKVGGSNYSFVVGFAEVDVDVETGAVTLVDYSASADGGTILHPRSFGGQLHGGGIQGFGIALGQKWVYDQKWGLAVAKRFYSNKPPTILDVPHEQEMRWAAADAADPFNPVGSKGIGEAPQGAGSAAVLCAIADALGDAYFYRTPVTTDMILTSLESLPRAFSNLAAHV